MNVKIKRIDKALPLPCYETDGSVGFDILARTDTIIGAGRISLVPGNIIVEVPEGYMLTIASRSSTPIKKGLLTPHGIGIIDHDYCGAEDEIKIQVYNFTHQPVTINRGDKIAQGLFVRVDKFSWEEVEVTKKLSRGGFGSTDKRSKKIRARGKAPLHSQANLQAIATSAVRKSGRLRARRLAQTDRLERTLHKRATADNRAHKNDRAHESLE